MMNNKMMECRIETKISFNAKGDLFIERTTFGRYRETQTFVLNTSEVKSMLKAIATGDTQTHKESIKVKYL